MGSWKKRIQFGPGSDVMPGMFQLLQRKGRALVALSVGLVCLAASDGLGAGRQILNFNPDWKFLQADPVGASAPEFADGEWTTVSTPHTYNDRDTFDDWSLTGHRGEQNQWGGRTWYRKTFTVPESFRGKKVFIEFEAVRQVAEVYLNGKYLGVCKTGFTPFGFDLTPHLRFDGPNVLAVMCDNRFMKDPWPADGARNNNGPGDTNGAAGLNIGAQPGGKLSDLMAHFNTLIPERFEELQPDQIPWNNPHWHPAHGGIYRNVYLHVTDPLHISLPLYSFLQTTGPYVYAREITERAAAVTVEILVQNGRDQKQRVEVRAEIYAPDGKRVLTLRQHGEVRAGGVREFQLSGVVREPQLWSPATPHVYQVRCSVRVSGEVVDTSEIPLGIRSFRWETDSGFYVNGQPLKLRGWGQKPTDEWPGLGAAQPDWVHHFTLQLMKEAGANLVRWGHCAGGPVQLKAADQLGLVTIQPGVDGEADTRGAAWELRAMAFRDVVIYFRNHPAVAIWEGGNQKVSREHARELRGLMDQYDPHGGRGYAHRRADQISAEFMDVGIGTEGGREIARLPVIEGEYNREESPRRVWDDFSPPNFGYPEAKGQTYQLTSEQFAVNQVAHFVRKMGATNHAGGANWIFSDSTSGGRVACEVARTSGEVDGVRLPKEAYYVCRVIFRADPQVHIIGHWTYPPGTRKDIYVAANGDAVELFVNGKSLGRGIQSDRYLFTFPEVTWEAGEIKAVSYVGGKPAVTQTKRTAGKPVALRLTPISGPGGWLADGADVVFVDVEAVDATGERCPTFQQRVEFSHEGPAQWLGGYESGRTNSIFQTELNLEAGINRVALRASRTPGLVTLTARSAGLRPGEVTLSLGPFEVAHSFSKQLPELPKVAGASLGWERAAANIQPTTKLQRDRIASAENGQFIRRFSYSGPNSTVRVATEARDGKPIYVDREYRFAGLPGALRGSDYIQAANEDKGYSAVDLMELAVAAGSVVFLAHDDRLPRPGWLVRQFQRTDLRLTVAGNSMSVFQHNAAAGTSLTLGANTDNEAPKSGQMYVVFVGAPRVGYADQSNQ
jgi:beta-galactosidase